jgi:hypothetical protein
LTHASGEAPRAWEIDSDGDVVLAPSDRDVLVGTPRVRAFGNTW